jgi:hypothetical protein
MNSGRYASGAKTRCRPPARQATPGGRCGRPRAPRSRPARERVGSQSGVRCHPVPSGPAAACAWCDATERPTRSAPARCKVSPAGRSPCRRRRPPRSRWALPTAFEQRAHVVCRNELGVAPLGQMVGGPRATPSSRSATPLAWLLGSWSEILRAWSYAVRRDRRPDRDSQAPTYPRELDRSPPAHEDLRRGRRHVPDDEGPASAD